MKPYLLLLSLSLCICHSPKAQYADLGTGGLKNQIWWLNWAGFTISEGATRTIQTNNGLTITVTFSGVTSNHLFPYVMNTWPGALLHLLYDFSDASLQPALYDAASGPISGSSHFKMAVTVKKGNNPVSFSLVAADAEASELSEISTLQTNGGGWSIVELFRNSGQVTDPVTGCGTQTATILDTHGSIGTSAQIGQNPIIATRSPGTTPLTLDITVDHGTTTGGMALAFGVLESVDRGDLPASYGTAEHELLYTTANSCNYLPPLPATSQSQDLKIGSVAGDPDPLQSADDNLVGADEDGVAAFPAYANNGSYPVIVTLGNTTGSDAYLTGWFDFNRNGQFDQGESVTAVVPNNATSATLTWTGLPNFLPVGSASGYGFRFRLSSNQQESQAATGNARDGEVEDYFVLSSALCSITATARPDTSVCPGSSIPLSAGGNHVTQYSWTGGTDLSDPSIANPIATPQAPATYTVTASNPQGCQASASIQVTFLPLPTIVRTGDTTLCEGKSVVLSASGGIINTWTSSDGLVQTTAPAITVAPAQSTKYYVQVKSGNGCSNTDSIAVQIHYLPTFGLTPRFPTVCKSDSILLVASGGDLYAWSSSTGPIPGDNPRLVAWLDANEDFEVKITDTICQVTNTLQRHVIVRPLPVTAVTKSNDINCTLGEATLHASGGYKYLWNAAPEISGLTSSDPIVRPLVPTKFYVTVTGTNGCSAKDSITVNTDFTSDISKYPVPSAFTPNNDGNNDCFRLKYWGRLMTLEMEVFNRWGERVFISRTPDDCWDGNFKGKPQPPGPYIYQIRAATPCGVAYRKGTVMLIR
jgi:gliding motility-associated-like protein